MDHPDITPTPRRHSPPRMSDREIERQKHRDRALLILELRHDIELIILRIQEIEDKLTGITDMIAEMNQVSSS